MKWYSVKKYRPPVNAKILVVTDFGTIWTAALEFDVESKRIYIDDSGDEIKDVTHFCVPDPIEIDD